MAETSVRLFSRFAQPARVIRALKKFGYEAELDGPDASWRNATVVIPAPERLAFTFVRESADNFDPEQSELIAEMSQSLSSSPATEPQSKALMLTSTFQIVLGILAEPEIDFEALDDPRLDVVCAVCEALDGVFKTPTSVRDAQGRVLWSVAGEAAEDAAAVWPRVIAAVSISEWSGAADKQLASRECETALPPTADQVARRALAFAAVTARAMLEQHPDNLDTLKTWTNRPQFRGLIPRLINSLRRTKPDPLADLLIWIEQIGLGNDLEPEEWEILQRPLGQLDSSQTVNSTWRLEGLVVLSWVLDRFPMPSHDQLTSFYPMWENLGLLDVKRAQQLLARPTLRSRDEIRTMREQLFAIHWRLRDYYSNGEVMDFEKYATECWFGPLNISHLPLTAR